MVDVRLRNCTQVHLPLHCLIFFSPNCCTDFALSRGCNKRELMSLKYYANDNICDVKAISEFRAMEERFNSLEDCCRAKFPQNISDCCEAVDNGCSLSGNHKFIPVSTSGICNPKFAIPDLMLATDFFLDLDGSNLLHQG